MVGMPPIATPATLTESARRRAAPPAWLVMLLVCSGQFLVILDVSVVNVALPAMRTGLGLSELGLQWIVNAYVITFAGFMLLGGRAADLFGRKRIFVLGLALFTVASLGGGLAQEPWQLIAARTVQGIGAAVLSPATLTILTTSFPAGPARTRAIATWTAVGAGGGAVGGLVGGTLTEFLSWRWVLLINVPVGALVLGGAVLWLTESRQGAGRRLDVPGALLVTAGLGLVAYGIVQTETDGWASLSALLPLAAGLVVVAAFLAVEARAKAPLMPLGLFRLRSVSSANGAMVLAGAAMFSMWYFLSLYVQNVLGYRPLEAGLSFIPHSLSIVLGSKIAPRLMNRLGAKPLAIAGAVMSACGMVWQGTMDVDGTYLGTILGPGILMALGAGLTATPIASIATSGADPADQGLVSGLMNTSRQMGGALGLSVLSTVAAARIEAGDGLKALADGYGLAFQVGSVVLLGSILLMLVALPQRRADAAHG
ncbi:MFS transporter [Streptomyces libani]|uniref:DHA2 family efflux MFS transporter permease subunit n=2 Tax=Streptomyces nigrescens TaxID=1920 RepID=A0ABY7INM9_STRNI|nr:MFS transporter [Streptomyces libani]MCX5450398.1 MFS transporter [Streptomyces libani]WAT99315.1 DHA2 family efflux MFS transporter permease subunit [Streptomyces libani subsp. libani]GGW04839.1 MFS transporter [Streptomyces libani subsp. libani]